MPARYRAGAIALAAGASATIAWTQLSPPSSPPAPAEPATAAGIRAAAARELTWFYRSQFAAAWSQLIPADQQVIPVAKWAQFYRECDARLTEWSILAVTSAPPVNGTAVADITYTEHGTAEPGAIEMAYAYIDGRWRYAAPLTIWEEGPVAVMLASARQSGICLTPLRVLT